MLMSSVRLHRTFLELQKFRIRTPWIHIYLKPVLYPSDRLHSHSHYIQMSCGRIIENEDEGPQLIPRGEKSVFCVFDFPVGGMIQDR